MILFCEHPTPLGMLLLARNEEGLCRVSLTDRPGPGWRWSVDALLAAACAQLDEYFAGRRTGFSVPLAEAGTPFQKQVWAGLRAIPYGQTRGYGQLAAALGRPGAARAVGGACRANPLLIVTPCHRVVGAGGALVGFGGKNRRLDAKAFLLALERQNVLDEAAGGGYDRKEQAGGGPPQTTAAQPASQ